MPELTTTAEPPVAVAKGRESPGKVAAYLLCGAVAIYLSTWTGAVTFYFTFQRQLLAEERSPNHTVLWSSPTKTQPAGSAGWSTRKVGGMEVPIPPGTIVEEKAEENALSLKISVEGSKESDRPVSFLIEARPVGFLVSIQREKLEYLGVPADASATDATVLEEVAAENLQTYEFGWSSRERQSYAARILSKMTLWEPGPLARFELAKNQATAVSAVENAMGETKILGASPAGVWITKLPVEAPAAWKCAGSWIKA